MAIIPADDLKPGLLVTVFDVAREPDEPPDFDFPSIFPRSRDRTPRSKRLASYHTMKGAPLEVVDVSLPYVAVAYRWNGTEVPCVLDVRDVTFCSVSESFADYLGLRSSREVQPPRPSAGAPELKFLRDLLARGEEVDDGA